MSSVVFNENCMAGMARYPDKYFDLAVADPPYGGGGTASPERKDLEGTLTYIGRVSRTGGGWAKKFEKKS